MMDINEIMAHLPHRYPFLLVDRVVEMELGKSIHAYKNVTINEPFFVGHFPHHPVMPGVLIMEALAQAAGILSFKSMDEKPSPDTVFYFAGIDEAFLANDTWIAHDRATTSVHREADALRSLMVLTSHLESPLRDELRQALTHYAQANAGAGNRYCFSITSSAD